MKITAIKQQSKRAGRYSIYVDGTYGFSLSESALLASAIASGQEIDAAQAAAYKRLSQDDKAYHNALRYAAARLRSEWEMQVYLQRKQVEDPVAQRIVERLRHVGLLDDRAFVRAWLSNRRQLKPTSNRKLRLELKQKHVPDALIEDVMGQEAPDEAGALRRLVAKKGQLARYRAEPAKLMQYLARQGFSYDDIRQAMAEYAEPT